MLLESLIPPYANSQLENLRALDWLNFLLAALLTGFGPYIAVHLTALGWAPASIGLVLTVSGLAGLLTQVPVGELIDVSPSKRALVAAGVAALALALLLYGLRLDFPSIFAAAVIQGASATIIGPGITAISLGLVGHAALAERLGRNQRFSSIGGLTAAAILGFTGFLLATRDIFFASALLALPAILALSRIHAPHINFARSCGAPECDHNDPPRSNRGVLLKDHRLLAFASCLFLFQLANASILPLIGERLVHAEGRWSSLVVSALLLVPQILVAVLAPWVGRTAGSWGRRPLLGIGLGVLPIRAAFLALTTDPVSLVAIQALDGLSGATLGVLTALVVADLTNGTGRFNLAQGFVGTLSGIGASLSTSLSGIVVTRFGDMAGWLSVIGIGVIAVVILWLFVPETRPLLPRQLLAIRRPASTG